MMVMAMATTTVLAMPMATEMATAMAKATAMVTAMATATAMAMETETAMAIAIATAVSIVQCCGRANTLRPPHGHKGVFIPQDCIMGTTLQRVFAPFEGGGFLTAHHGFIFFF